MGDVHDQAGAANRAGEGERPERQSSSDAEADRGLALEAARIRHLAEGPVPGDVRQLARVGGDVGRVPVEGVARRVDDDLQSCATPQGDDGAFGVVVDGGDVLDVVAR